MKKGGEQTFKNTFFLFTEQVALTSHGVAVRPKITNTPPRTSKCLPWGGSSPKYTTCLPGCCLMCVWIVTKERKKEKKKQAASSSSHCASFKQDSVYCFSLCCISNNSGVDGRPQERVCVCVSVSDSGAQRRNIWAFFYLLCSLLFIFSALWWTWTVTCEDGCKCRGRRLLTWRVHFDFREIYLPFLVVSFPAQERISLRKPLTIFSKPLCPLHSN